MYGITLAPCPWSLIFKPLLDRADGCWWYLNGYGIQLPVPTDADGVESQQAKDDQIAEYSKWLDDRASYRVGVPGWFSRYADYADTNWVVYFACDESSAEKRKETLEWLEGFTNAGTDWFGNASRWSLPREVAFACRNIDDAYWDIFIRDEADHREISHHLTTSVELNSRPFMEAS